MVKNGGRYVANWMSGFGIELLLRMDDLGGYSELIYWAFLKFLAL